MLLVPSDPLNPRRPDEHFADEAAAATTAGIDVALIDHDALVRGRVEDAVARVSSGARAAVYRGWMVRAEEYAAFEHALSTNGTALRTDASAFRRAHELPGWYAALSAHTPESVWTTGPSEDAFRERCRELGAGPVVLRDYTKSMKHHWHEAAFIPDVADLDAAWNIAARFLSLREESFVGGFVLRRFESLRPDEVRTWWVHGRCSLTTVHPDSQVTKVPDGIDLSGLAPIVRGLALPFVTVDLALRDDGVWRVMELGDGQVSDRPRAMAAAEFIRAVMSV